MQQDHSLTKSAVGATSYVCLMIRNGKLTSVEVKLGKVKSTALNMKLMSKMSSPKATTAVID